MSRIEDFKYGTLGVPGNKWASRRSSGAQEEPSPPTQVRRLKRGAALKSTRLKRGAALKSTERTGTASRTGG